MWEDPIVSEVRQARESLAARFDFEVAAIFADLRARQEALGSRLVQPPPSPTPTPPSPITFLERPDLPPSAVDNR